MEKKRVRSNNGEARKERLDRQIKKDEPNVPDYTDIARELAEIVRENYLTSFQLGLSLWEGNLKMLGSQVEQWLSVQERYAIQVRELFEKLPTDVFSIWNGNPKFDNSKVIAFQRDYFSSAINTSDRLVKETLGLMRNSVNRAFSSLNDYINLIRT